MGGGPSRPGRPEELGAAGGRRERGDGGLDAPLMVAVGSYLAVDAITIACYLGRSAGAGERAIIGGAVVVARRRGRWCVQRKRELGGGGTAVGRLAGQPPRRSTLRTPSAESPWRCAIARRLNPAWRSARIARSRSAVVCRRAAPDAAPPLAPPFAFALPVPAAPPFAPCAALAFPRPARPPFALASPVPASPPSRPRSACSARNAAACALATICHR